MLCKNLLVVRTNSISPPAKTVSVPGVIPTTSPASNQIVLFLPCSQQAEKTESLFGFCLLLVRISESISSVSMGMGKGGKSAKKSAFPEIGWLVALLTYLSYAVLIGVRCVQIS